LYPDFVKLYYLGINKLDLTESVNSRAIAMESAAMDIVEKAEIMGPLELRLYILNKLNTIVEDYCK
jgi:hypothetical protein